jgi:hypothetical protein
MAGSEGRLATMNGPQRKIVVNTLFGFAGVSGLLLLAWATLMSLGGEDWGDFIVVLVVIGSPVLLLSALTYVAGLYVRAGGADS